jgi:hypothetical protein
VLPHPDDRPACRDQGIRVAIVAIHCPLELWPPIGAIYPRATPMDGASVPEAPVNEHRDLTPRKHDVWPNSTSTEVERKIASEPKTSSMQRRAQSQLRASIAPSNCTHVSRSARRRCGWDTAALTLGHKPSLASCTARV